MKTTLIIYLLVSFLLYILYVYFKYGVLKSISDSYYFIKAKPIFTFFIWNTAICFIFLGQTTLMFLAGSALAFVGASPMFKEKHVAIVHFVGAITGIILGMFSLVFDFGLWWLVLPMIVFTGLCNVFEINNRTWWVEIVAFLTMIIGLII